MQFDPAWFLLGLGKVYLLALGVLAAVGAVVASTMQVPAWVTVTSSSSLSE